MSGQTWRQLRFQGPLEVGMDTSDAILVGKDKLKFLYFFLSGESSSLSYAENLSKLYDGVETFVMFIGYPRSSHSLVGAILDAHPEIIIPHQYDVLRYWIKYRPSTARKTKISKYHLFYDLHQLSREQAMFGIRSKYKKGKMGGYGYNVPGLWQGGYQTRIKVR